MIVDPRIGIGSDPTPITNSAGTSSPKSIEINKLGTNRLGNAGANRYQVC